MRDRDRQGVLEKPPAAIVTITRTSFAALCALAVALAFAATWPFRGDLAQGYANRTMLRPLAFVSSWRYQRQNISFESLAADPASLLVIDAGALTHDDIQRLKSKPDGRRRLVLAYLKIAGFDDGDAAWQEQWRQAASEGADGDGCLPARARRIPYWQDAWRDDLYRKPWSKLSAIIAAGFDGAYLDGAGAFSARLAFSASARDDMVTLIRELAAKARRERPGFLIMAQDGEALLSDPVYRLAIDAIAVENLLYGRTERGVRNPAREIGETMALLRLLQQDGKPVFAVEHLQSAAHIDQAARELRRRGVVAGFETGAFDGRNPIMSQEASDRYDDGCAPRP